MNTLSRLGVPPLPVGLRLVADAAWLWLLVRVGLFAVPAARACRSVECVGDVLAASVSWSPRTSGIVVGVTAALCFVQVRRMREVHLLRNLGIGWGGQLRLSIAAVVPLEAMLVLCSSLLGAT